MARDIKKMFENYEAEQPKLKASHQARFEAKLDKAFSESPIVEKNSTIHWFKIAAMIVVMVAVSFFGYQHLSKSDSRVVNDATNNIVETSSKAIDANAKPRLTLASISPDLKKIEEYYMTGINVQLASLKITDENKDVVDGYMQRLAELDNEYNSLNTELNKVGPTEASVTALIDNLKLRLDLLFKLKNKLKELKNQNNEEFKIIQN